MVQKIDTKQFESMDKTGLKVIDFNATWWGPWRMLSPILEELSEDYAGKAEFFAIDTDENGSLAEKFNIISIPAVVFLKNGEKVDMHVGFAPKQEFTAIIEKNI